MWVRVNVKTASSFFFFFHNYTGGRDGKTSVVIWVEYYYRDGSVRNRDFTITPAPRPSVYRWVRLRGRYYRSWWFLLFFFSPVRFPFLALYTASPWRPPQLDYVNLYNNDMCAHNNREKKKESWKLLNLNNNNIISISFSRASCPPPSGRTFASAFSATIGPGYV